MDFLSESEMQEIHDIQEAKPSVINFSYQAMPDINRMWSPSYVERHRKNVQSQSELIYSDDYEIIKDEYIQGVDDGQPITYHHIIAKRVERTNE